jgi:hypothetical protein
VSTSDNRRPAAAKGQDSAPQAPGGGPRGGPLLSISTKKFTYLPKRTKKDKKSRGKVQIFILRLGKQESHLGEQEQKGHVWVFRNEEFKFFISRLGEQEQKGHVWVFRDEAFKFYISRLGEQEGHVWVDRDEEFKFDCLTFGWTGGLLF